MVLSHFCPLVHSSLHPSNSPCLLCISKRPQPLLKAARLPSNVHDISYLTNPECGVQRCLPVFISADAMVVTIPVYPPLGTGTVISQLSVKGIAGQWFSIGADRRHVCWLPQSTSCGRVSSPALQTPKPLCLSLLHPLNRCFLAAHYVPDAIA